MNKTGFKKRDFPGPYPEPHTVNGDGSGKLPPDGDAQPDHNGGDPPMMTSHPIGVSYPEGQDFGPYTDHKGEGLYHSFKLDFTNDIPYNSGGVHPHTGLLLFSLALNARPDVIVETGTFYGTSTLYLAKACEIWRSGKVYTIEPDLNNVHPSIFENPWIEVIEGLSEEQLPKLMEKVEQVDFAFLDSWKRLSFIEFMLIRDHMVSGSIAAFHDTQFLNSGHTFYEMIQQHIEEEWDQMLFCGTPKEDNPHHYFGNADDRGFFALRRRERDPFLDIRDHRSDEYEAQQIVQVESAAEFIKDRLT